MGQVGADEEGHDHCGLAVADALDVPDVLGLQAEVDVRVLLDAGAGQRLDREERTAEKTWILGFFQLEGALLMSSSQCSRLSCPLTMRMMWSDSLL